MIDRIEATSDELAGEVVRRLEGGETAVGLVKSFGMDAFVLIEAVARFALGGEGALGPSMRQVRPSRPSLESAFADDAMAGLFPAAARPSRLALAAGVLQILDFWDASHAAAQEADDLGESATAAYWHMIAHRREPDAGNAHYWARRVGHHPIFKPLAKAARPLLEASGEGMLAARLIPDGTWSPSALIDLATRTRPETSPEPLARRLQRLEMAYLLGAGLDAVR